MGRMHFELYATVVEEIHVDPAEFAGLTLDEIADDLLALVSVDNVCDWQGIYEAALAIYEAARGNDD